MNKTETRKVSLRLDPAFAAYLEWIDATDRPFLAEEYDIFAAGYRAARVEPDVEAAP